MKNILSVLAVTAALVACNDNASYNDRIANPESPDSNMFNPDAAPAPTVYSPSNGDVTYRDDQVLVMRNGEWVQADSDVTLENGAIVYRDGTVKKDDRKTKLEEGEVVTRAGNFFDRAGHAIENAWDDVKQGVKDAGNEIEKEARKAGEKVDETFDGDNDNNR